MLKKFMFAMVPMIMLAGSAIGDDDLLSKISSIDVDSIGAASAEVQEFDLGDVDVDGLLDNEGEGEEDAIAACFRRVGYGYGFGRRHYSYNHWYSPCYTSHYTYTYYRPLYCYRPVHYTPVYTPCYTSYWGCY